MESKDFGRGSYRDGTGRSVEGGHISQRIKGTEGKSEGRWKKLSAQLTERCQKLEEQMAKLRKLQVIQGFTFYIDFYLFLS